MTKIEDLKKIILPLLEEEDIELVEFNFIPARGKSILKLLVDKKDSGINIEACARLNQRIGEFLDTQEIIKNRYTLEVSSPGLDRPLKTRSDFLRCINKKVKFFLSESIDGKMELEGIIREVKDALVNIEQEGTLISIPLDKIIQAKQLIQI